MCPFPRRAALAALILVLSPYVLGAPQRTPAEFEPVEAVVIRWNPGLSDGLHGFLAAHVQAAGATAYVTVENDWERRAIEQYLRDQGIREDNLRFVEGATNTVWVRDYGAIGTYSGLDGTLAFQDFTYKPRERGLDNAAGYAVWRQVAGEVQPAGPRRMSLALEGGDLMTDGFGTLITSTLTADHNRRGARGVAWQFGERLGAQRSFFLDRMPSAPQNHLDMYMKFLDEETLLVGQYTAGSAADKTLENNVRYLSTLTSCYGRPYRIFRVPLVGLAERSAGGTPVQRTYTNSLIVNNYVLVPVYGSPFDEQALSIYREAMPGYRVVGYDCSRVIREDGAIHCLTKEIHTDRTVAIRHPRFTQAIRVGETVRFEAQCWSPAPVDQVSLHVVWPGGNQWETYPMEAHGEQYMADLTPGAPGEIRYCISAQASGVTVYKPQNGYDGGYLTLQVWQEV